MNTFSRWYIIIDIFITESMPVVRVKLSGAESSTTIHADVQKLRNQPNRHGSRHDVSNILLAKRRYRSVKIKRKSFDIITMPSCLVM
jgi:hypothetical protein